MYKRRFTAPLHQPPAAATSSDTAVKVGKQQTHATNSTDDPDAEAAGKENVTPAQDGVQIPPDDAVAKRPRLFVRPAHKAPAAAGSTISSAGPAARAAPVTSSSDTAAPRTFSVLYCKREKFKVPGGLLGSCSFIYRAQWTNSEAPGVLIQANSNMPQHH